MPSNPEQPPSERPLRLRRLLPAGDRASIEQVVDELHLVAAGSDETRKRPYLLLNMIATTDGRATLGGRSGPLGGRADKALLYGLRTAVDAVMAGAGTVRAEHYGQLIRDDRERRIRRDRGLDEEPLACIVSGRLALDSGIPLLAESGTRVAILTSSEASLPQDCRAEISYVRSARDGQLDLPRAMAELYERLGVRTLLCEGGPHLNAQLLAHGLVDELFLTLSPKLGGGDAVSETLRIVSGPEFDPPLELELAGALEHDSYLFLRYRVSSSPA
ncbi:MAG TPA: dihydrofolate reductase family protein [Solirubrobacteraceae bacterium]|jgi:riboflavin biosynthesis pyrimidine reductase|nr:dihydrofolate reductase family protein [Solirubrobacteraceae bacterium]